MYFFNVWDKNKMKETLRRCIRLLTRKCVNSSIVMAKMQIDPFCGPIGQSGVIKLWSSLRRAQWQFRLIHPLTNSLSVGLAVLSEGYYNWYVIYLVRVSMSWVYCIQVFCECFAYCWSISYSVVSSKLLQNLLWDFKIDQR